MTPQEFAPAFALLGDAYPQQFSRRSSDEITRQFGLFAQVLAAYPADLVMQAVLQAIHASEWMPSPAELKRRAEDIRWHDEDPGDAWDHLLRQTKRALPVCNSETALRALEACGGWPAFRDITRERFVAAFEASLRQLPGSGGHALEA